MKFSFRAEPVVWTALLSAFLVVLVEFGVPLTEGQQTALQGLLVALLAVFMARPNVASRDTLEKAGVSLTQVKQVADSCDTVLVPQKCSHSTPTTPGETL